MNNNKEKTIICRCEDVTLAEIEQLIAEGFTSIDEIKRLSRCGMGPCQGRTCRQLLVNELVKATGREPGDLKMPAFRPPTKPVKLGILLADDGAEREKDAGNGVKPGENSSCPA